MAGQSFDEVMKELGQMMGQGKKTYPGVHGGEEIDPKQQVVMTTLYGPPDFLMGGETEAEDNENDPDSSIE